MTALTVTLSPGKISSSLPYPIEDYDLETLIALVFLLKAKSINLLTGLVNWWVFKLISNSSLHVSRIANIQTFPHILIYTTGLKKYR